MEKVILALEEIKKMNLAYQISTDAVEKLKEEMVNGKVCVPVIGKFSTGKSALINTILGYRRRILREDITPETAIPAEIVYSQIEEAVTITKNDGSYESLAIEDYRNYEADANTVKSARIKLRNSFLEGIPDIMIVDMPGFESGFEIHNKAIDNYLTQSLAYIVTFAADDMIVRSSIGNILRELCLHDMPLCIVITKCDKKNDDFDLTFANLKANLKRYIGERELRYCQTSSFQGNAEELEGFLKELQEKSQDILANKYKNSVLAIIENTENYLKTTLKSMELSESELDEEEEKLKKQLSMLDSKFSKEQEEFEAEISECIEEIKADVKSAMEAEESTLVTMVMNKQSINEHLNSVIRRSVTVSVQRRLIPRVEGYLKKVSNTINGESIGDIPISFYFDLDKLKKGITTNIVAVVTALVIGNPILALIAGIIMKIIGNKKREEVKNEIRMKLRSEVFPQTLRDIGNSIEMAISKQIKFVNQSIEEELKNQRETLEKAMADVRSKINDEKARKDNLLIDINNDLVRIGEIKDGLRRRSI